jgi:hypothetical protein
MTEEHKHTSKQERASREKEFSELKKEFTEAKALVETVQTQEVEKKIENGRLVTLNIPQNMIDSLYALWRGEPVEWAGGLDFDPKFPDVPKRILLSSGSIGNVKMPDIGVIEVFFHFHPNEKIPGDEGNACFSLQDTFLLLDQFCRHPELQKKPFAQQLLIGATGQLWLMKIPTSVYQSIEKMLQRNRSKIEQMRARLHIGRGVPDLEIFLYLLRTIMGNMEDKILRDKTGLQWDGVSETQSSGAPISLQEKHQFYMSSNVAFRRVLKNMFKGKIEITELKKPYEITMFVV